MSFCESLREECAELWEGLHRHPFLREMAAGTLPLDTFRFFVEQDLYFFLPDLARAVAIGAAVARDEREMRHFAEELVAVVERENENNRLLLERLDCDGRGRPRRRSCPGPRRVAYAGYLVSTAVRGGPLEVMTALLPCTWSYADIGLRARDEIAATPSTPTGSASSAGDEYQELIAGRRRTLDELAARADETHRRRLAEIFRMATTARASVLGHGLPLRAMAGREGGAMKAAVLVEGGQVRVEDVAGSGADGWALVSARAAGVCGTELHFLEGMIPPPHDRFVLGHESAGVVLEAPAGSAVGEGDRVAVYNFVGCGRCASCRTGRESLCTDPVGQLGFSLDGGFADVVRVPGGEPDPAARHGLFRDRRPCSPAAACRSFTPRAWPGSGSVTPSSSTGSAASA